MAEQLSLFDAIEQTEDWKCHECGRLNPNEQNWCCNIGAFMSDYRDWDRQKNPAALRNIEEAQDTYEAHQMALPNTRRGKLIRTTSIPKQSE